jgi:transcription termination factor NusB
MLSKKKEKVVRRVFTQFLFSKEWEDQVDSLDLFLKLISEELEILFDEEMKSRLLDLNQIYLKKEEKINDLIESHCTNWDLKRLKKTDLSILRSFVTEFFLDFTQKDVLLKDSAHVARELSCDSSPVFIQGVLGQVFQPTSSNGN